MANACSLYARKIKSIQHLGSDSTEPPLVENELRLYSMRFCPFAHRVHLVLNAKNVPYNVVYINLSDKPKWYLEKFSAGRVPALLFEGEFLYESVLLADFLDEQYPEPALQSKSALRKIKDKLLVDSFGKVTSAFYDTVMKEVHDPKDYEQLVSNLKLFEDELKTRGSPYFSGEKPGFVDYMIWPWFERFDAIPLIIPDAKIPYESYPLLVSWKNHIKLDKAIMKHFMPDDIHAKHFELRKKNLNAFDLFPDKK